MSKLFSIIAGVAIVLSSSSSRYGDDFHGAHGVRLSLRGPIVGIDRELLLAAAEARRQGTAHVRSTNNVTLRDPRLTT